MFLHRVAIEYVLLNLLKDNFITGCSSIASIAHSSNKLYTTFQTDYALSKSLVRILTFHWPVACAGPVQEILPFYILVCRKWVLLHWQVLCIVISPIKGYYVKEQTTRLLIEILKLYFTSIGERVKNTHWEDISNKTTGPDSCYNFFHSALF